MVAALGSLGDSASGVCKNDETEDTFGNRRVGIRRA